MHMFNTVKKINQANKYSTFKGMNISAGDITRPKSFFFLYVSMYTVNNSAQDMKRSFEGGLFL